MFVEGLSKKLARSLVVPITMSGSVVWTAALAEPRFEHPQPSFIDAGSEIEARARLTDALLRQAQRIAPQPGKPATGQFSRTNLSKLGPALQRQRQVLLSAGPLLATASARPQVEQPVTDTLITGSVSATPSNPVPQPPMARFRQKLQALTAGLLDAPVTVLHVSYGNAGEGLFEQAVAKQLKAQFGDAGHGMVAPARNTFQSDSQTFEISKKGRWRMDSMQQRNKAGYGLSGMRAVSRSSHSSMTFSSKNGAFDWVGVTMATGPSQGKFKLTINGKDHMFDARAAEAGSKLFRVKLQGTEATLHPGGGAQTGILNWVSGRHAMGVRYIHMSLPNGGEGLEAALVAQDMRELAPDLIIYDGAKAPNGKNVAHQDMIRQLRASAVNADLVHLPTRAPWHYEQQRHCLTPARNAKSDSALNLQNAVLWQAPGHLGTACEQALQDGLQFDAGQLIDKHALAFFKWLSQPPKPGTSVALNQ